jgi:hypothetical protein
VALLKKRGRSIRVLRKLVAMLRDYPREPLLAALGVATQYGLDDMARLESLVLRHIARDFFPLPHELARAGRSGEGDRPSEKDSLSGQGQSPVEDDNDR